MKTQLVITDVTRMNRGNVCIAGYDKAHRAIRPVTRPGIPESILFQDGKAVIFPFAVVDLTLLQDNPQPPHCEDVTFVITSVEFIRAVKSREEVLKWSLFKTVAEIFEQPINSDFGFYVMDCQGPRSLGTILPATIVKVVYAPAEDGGAWDYRLHFYDHADTFFRLKIVDFTWHHYCDSLRAQGIEPAEVAAKLTHTLKEGKTYLRIGLSRGWKEFPDRCYLQVTGIHTFPDYLEGKTFADLPAFQGGTGKIRDAGGTPYTTSDDTEPY
jgi:hypothetical protein